MSTDREYNSARTALMATSNGSNYVSELETIVPQLSTAKLSDIQIRIARVQMVWGFAQYSELLNFIQVLITKELESRVIEETISPEAKALAEVEILEMQQMMGDSMKEMMNDLMVSWEQATHYKEQWDLSMNMNLNIEETSIEWGVTLSNYEAITQMFDQKFEWEIDAFIRGMADGESVDVRIETLIDFISTEGNMYLLMENLKLTDNSKNKEFETLMKPFIDKISELGKSKTYLSFSDVDTQAALEILWGISQNNINTQIDAMMAEPLLEAYASEGNTYMLRPSMYFCNMGKSLSSVFDPFYDNDTCSESQYQDMVEEMQEAGISISLNLENENTLTINIDNEEVEWDITVQWADESLSSVKAYLYDPNNKEINNITFSYIPSASLSFSLMAEQEVSMGLDMTFGNNGSLSTLDMNLNVVDFMMMNAKYANNSLSMTATGGSYGTNFNCEANGQLKTDYIDMDGGCIIESDSITYMFPGQSTIEMNSSLLIDTRSGKNNLDMTFDMKAWSSPIISLDVKNTGTRMSIPAAKIQAPSKTITQEEAFGSVYENLYDGGATNNYDPYYSIDPETGEDLICQEYEYNAETDYDTCVEYVPDTYDFDEYYKIDENWNEFYCEEYEYNAEENFDACKSYLPLQQ